MSSDAEILALGDRLGEAGHDAVTAPVSLPSRERTIHHYEGIITMTGTQENTRPVPLIGQAVGQAEASLTRLLTGILAESGTSRETYLGLQRLTALGGEATPDAYERDLSDWLELDATAAARLAGALVTAGLAETGLGQTGGGVIRLTARGRGLRERVLAASAKITGSILATIDHDDLDTTVRTLDEITRRARGIPAGPNTTEGNR